MKKLRRGNAAFTLVEMLVVIVIISLVAMAVSQALRGAKRQANATKCRANMKNLYDGIVSYLADKNEYPAAASYELYEKRLNPKGKVENYYERCGWVAWVTKDGGRREGGQTPWEKNSGQSHAEQFLYPANTDKIMRNAISEGALFKYVGKDYTTYQCPEHRRSAEDKPVYLAYAMNGYAGSKGRGFGSYNERNWWYYKLQDIDKDARDSSKIALFIEIDEGEESSSENRKGQDGSKKLVRRELPDDCCWNCDDDGAEIGRFSHRSGNQNYCHVVFLDGHVASIPEEENPDDPEDPGWNGHANIKEVFKTLGNGTF